MPTNYKPGMSFEEFFEANDYERSVEGYIKAQTAYGKYKKIDEQYGGYAGSAGGVAGQIDKISDPLYGLEAFERIAAASTPSYSDYAARVAQMGGSARQAREQEEAARREGQGSAYDAFRQFRLGKDSNVLNASLGLYSQNLQNQQFQQQQKNSFLNSLLGIGAGLAGQYVGSKLFGPQQGGGAPTYFPNPFGGGYGNTLGTGGTGTSGYPVPGANFGGTQKSGQQMFGNPPGQNPYWMLGFN